MDRKKVALLLALSVLLVFLVSGTAWTAHEVLASAYESAGDGVSLLALLAFLSYADAELILFLREKFEKEKKSSSIRGTVLIYLVMMALLVAVGILFFMPEERDEITESLGEGGSYSIPPEPEEEILLPQIPLLDAAVKGDLAAEADETPISIEQSISGPLEDVVETASGASDDALESEETAKEVEETPLEDVENIDSCADAVKESPEMESPDERERLPSASAEEEGAEKHDPQVLQSTAEEKVEDEGEEVVVDSIRVPEKPMMYYIPRLYEVTPPSVPSLIVKDSTIAEIEIPSAPLFKEEVNAYLVDEEEEVFADDSLDDFWASFYIAGEDDLTLEDGIYYMTLFVNDSETGSITVYAENGEVSLLSSELMTYLSGTVTDEFASRLFSSSSEYISLDYITSLGAEASYDAISYEVRLTLSPEDMPIQILSIGGLSSFRHTRRPITGGIDLEPAVFTLTSSYYLNARVRNFLGRNIKNGLSLSFSASNSARLYDLYLDFNYYIGLTPYSFSFSLGSYRFHYDFPDSLIRLSCGNVSSDLFSPRGSSVGIRFDRSYAYAPNTYRRPSQIEEVIVVDKPSEVQIFNEGREIFRRTLDIGTYRLRDFILYTGANRITITMTPLDGSEAKTIDLDVLYAASLLAPGEVYYGASLVTGRSTVSSNASKLDSSFRVPLGGGRSLEYNLLDFVLSGYVRAGLSPTVSIDATLAFQNSPNELTNLRPNMKFAFELTNANILGTTRFGLNVTERTKEDGSWNALGFYANIGHQIRTGMTELSSVSLGLNYSSPEELRISGRHRIGLSTSLSGRLGIVSWGLSGSGGIYTDKISSSYWSTSGTLSLSASRSIWLSASMSISGTGRTNPVISGRVYATIRYDGGSTSITGGSYNTSISTRYGLGRHSLSASVDTEDLMNFNDYSFDVGYSYQGDYVDLSLGLDADDSLSRIGADLSLRTSSVFADGLLAFRSYIPSNYVLISQSGALRGNSVSVGSAGYSRMSELPQSFGVSIYEGLSAAADSFIVYSQGKDTFSTAESFPVNIPSSTRKGYVLRLNADNTYASSALITLPDGTPWINGSSPIYRIVDGNLEMTESYLFTDGDGRFVTSSMEVGEYAFDVPYGNSWILVHFRVEDRPDDLGLLQMLEQGELREAETMSDVYDYEMDLSVTGVMSQDAFFEMLYGAEVAA